MTDQMTPKTEADWMRVLTNAAMRLGWDWLHIGRTGKYAANGAKGTLGKGWPDLLLIKSGRTLFVECKLDGEDLKPEQKQVLRLLMDAGNEVAVWRPSDFAEAMHVLAGGA